MDRSNLTADRSLGLEGFKGNLGGMATKVKRNSLFADFAAGLGRSEGDQGSMGFRKD